MKRILMVASLAIALVIARCGNQNQSPSTNSPANADSTSNNFNRDTSSGMSNDSLRTDTMKSDSSVK